jgi:hypothetical protein
MKRNIKDMEVLTAHCKVLFPHLSAGIEENHERSKSKKVIPRPIFQPSTS